MKIYGMIPARMASSRFPGKPLYPICDRPMIEHVFRRAAKFPHWESLQIATCDTAIAEFAVSQQFPVMMTSDKHTRCLDRVAEAIGKATIAPHHNDVIVCVQGDEPMLHPDMITAAIQPFVETVEINCTVLGMAIAHEAQFLDPNTVKIIHDMNGDVLYTSRSPVPYCKKFSPALQAKRIYGILAFRWHFLEKFNQLSESPLELIESCDSNRIIDHGYRQRVAPYPYHPSFSVDCPEDIAKVEKHIVNDVLWGSY